MISEATENDLLEIVNASGRLDPAVEKAWKIAASHPRALYHFMQSFIGFNFYAAPSATKLAANLKLIERDIEASCVFAALPDEYGQYPRIPDHRTLALALLSVIGDYAGLSAAERYFSAPRWHRRITNQLQRLYQGKPGDRRTLVRAMGAHWASELLADREYTYGDKIVRQERKGKDFDRFLRDHYSNSSLTGGERHEIKLGGHVIDPWEWIQAHGTAEAHAVEFEHFRNAQNAVNETLRTPEPENREQVWGWICEGAREFADLQNRFFINIAAECRVIAGMKPEKTGFSIASMKTAMMELGRRAVPAYFPALSPKTCFAVMAVSIATVIAGWNFLPSAPINIDNHRYKRVVRGTYYPDFVAANLQGYMHLKSHSFAEQFCHMPESQPVAQLSGVSSEFLKVTSASVSDSHIGVEMTMVYRDPVLPTEKYILRQNLTVSGCTNT